LNAEIGTRYRLEGMLLLAERGPILQVDDGGVWALELFPEQRTQCGRRVLLEGVRTGFDRIAVDWLSPAPANG
jgi:hypothetical protein